MNDTLFRIYYTDRTTDEFYVIGSPHKETTAKATAEARTLKPQAVIDRVMQMTKHFGWIPVYVKDAEVTA